MERIAGKRYLWVQTQLEHDMEYAALLRQLREQEAGFAALMDTLPESQREILFAYIGTLGELENLALELACFAP
jgi:hypothetical protein